MAGRPIYFRRECGKSILVRSWRAAAELVSLFSKMSRCTVLPSDKISVWYSTVSYSISISKVAVKGSIVNQNAVVVERRMTVYSTVLMIFV